MSVNAPKSNLRGYAAAVLEASLHNLLTRARLTRVLTHCTWENIKVATSRPGSKVGRFVSGTDMPLWVDMVAREGEWAGFFRRNEETLIVSEPPVKHAKNACAPVSREGHGRDGGTRPSPAARAIASPPRRDPRVADIPARPGGIAHPAGSRLGLWPRHGRPGPAVHAIR